MRFPGSLGTAEDRAWLGPWTPLAPGCSERPGARTTATNRRAANRGRAGLTTGTRIEGVSFAHISGSENRERLLLEKKVVSDVSGQDGFLGAWKE